MLTKKKLIILGSTGSIGVQTLDVVRTFPEQFEIVGLAAGKNIQLFKQQIKEFKPKFVCLQNAELIDQLTLFGKTENLNFTSYVGEKGLNQLVTHPVDLLVVAIVGTAALMPTYLAIQQKTAIALACKEVLVSAGDIIMTAAKQKGVPILPVDSEHAALQQCLAGIKNTPQFISKLILTASGGPFWTWPKEKLSTITKADALKHPSWVMGQKITIDSATLMNKGLEVIEAHHLFSVPYEQIEAVIHPQSLVHSMVEFTDGTTLAQLSLPDMRLPIQYALTYPEKLTNPWPKLNFNNSLKLEFHKPDMEKFPLFNLAYQLGKKGGNMPAIMNAANEAAVNLFLADQITYSQIVEFVLKAVNYFKYEQLTKIDDIVALEKKKKNYVRNLI